MNETFFNIMMTKHTASKKKLNWLGRGSSNQLHVWRCAFCAFWCLRLAPDAQAQAAERRGCACSVLLIIPNARLNLLQVDWRDALNEETEALPHRPTHKLATRCVGFDGWHHIDLYCDCLPIRSCIPQVGRHVDCAALHPKPCYRPLLPHRYAAAADGHVPNGKGRRHKV